MMVEPTKTPKKGEVVEEVEEYTSLGEEERGGKSPLSRFMPVILPLAIALVVSYFMVSMMGVPKDLYNTAIVGLQGETASLREQATTAEESYTNLIERVATIEAMEPEVIDLTNYTTKPELAGLIQEISVLKEWRIMLDSLSLDNLAAATDIKFAEYEAIVAGYTVIMVDYETRIAEMEALLEELALIDDEGEVITHSETTRWALDPYATNHSAEVTIGYMVSPYRIEDDDDYSVVLTILNQTTTPITDLNLEVALRPSSGDRVMVNQDEIYMDTTHSPYYFWDTRVVERTDGTCRRVVFSCIGVNAIAGTQAEGEPIVPGTTVLRLDLTLAYK